jgi:hypothetical protein
MTTENVLENLKATAQTRAKLFSQTDSSVLTAYAMLECVTGLRTALADAISTYRTDDKTVLVSVERIEAWIAALNGTP